MICTSFILSDRIGQIGGSIYDSQPSPAFANYNTQLHTNLCIVHTDNYCVYIHTWKKRVSP